MGVDEDSTDNKNLVKLEGVEGLWYEQPDILSKYKRRDEELENMCYSHYGKMIRSGGKLENTESIDAENSDDDSEEEPDDDDEDPNLKFHFIITKHIGLGKKYLNTQS